MNENLIKLDIINLTNIYRLFSIHDSTLHMGIVYAYPNINFSSLVYVDVSLDVNVKQKQNFESNIISQNILRLTHM